MDTIPSINDMHKACLTSGAPRHDSTDEDEEQMEKLFEAPSAGSEVARQRELLSSTGPSPVSESTDTTTTTTTRNTATGASGGVGVSDGATAGAHVSGELKAPATVWTSGFEQDYERPSTPLKVPPHTDDCAMLHGSSSFPHMHHPLKKSHHHHHHRRKHKTSISEMTRQNSFEACSEEGEEPQHKQQPETDLILLQPASTVDAQKIHDTDTVSTDPAQEHRTSDKRQQTILQMSPEGVDIAAATGVSTVSGGESFVVDMTCGMDCQSISSTSTTSPVPSGLVSPTINIGGSNDEEPIADSGRGVGGAMHEDGAVGSQTAVGQRHGPSIESGGSRSGSFSQSTGSGGSRLLPRLNFKLLPGRRTSESPVSQDSEECEEYEDQETSPLMADQSPPHIAGLLKPCIRSGESETEDEARKRIKVKFNIGSEVEDTETEQTRQPTVRTKQKRPRRRKRESSPHSWHRHPGNEHHLARYSSCTHPTTPDEARHLLQHDLDDITSHRFHEVPAYRRSHVSSRTNACSVISFGPRGGEKEQHRTFVRNANHGGMKRSFDHQPHDLFVELCELKQSVYGPEWKETARWIKYEEDVEGVESNRWGKPHVAFLNFHSLFSLRKGLDRGAVLLDLEEQDLQGIANRVVEYMVACDQIPAEQKEAVVGTLLLKHRHVNEDTFRVARRESKSQLDADGKLVTVTTNLSDSHSTGNLSNNLRSSFKRAGIQKVFSAHSIRRHSSFDNTSSLNRVQSNGSFRERLFSTGSRPEELNTINPETGEGSLIQETFQNTELMKKLPEGSEATAVLVGAVDFLKQPTIAFVRLAQGVMMDNLVEVPIPVRFLFVLLGPYHGEMDYHEVGRSISTLMSDKHFHEVAYRAHSRGQLLSAINEFLNASIVLPPSEWTNTDLIPVEQIREKAQEMVKRKETIRKKRLQADPSTPPPVVVEEPVQRATLRSPRREPPRDPLKRVGKPFYGAYMDIKMRMPLYLSDIKDGLSGQVMAGAIFIFFASLSPAITFGGMYADKTEELIGVSETLLVTSINGIILALFACQPLLIAGATGPLMIFDLSLYSFAKAYDLEYLPMRVWISIWMTIFCTILTAFEGVTIVKHLTRFTEEIFSTLVCLIFIYGAFEKLADIFQNHPLKGEYCYEDANHTEIINATIINGTLYNGTNAMGEPVEFASQPQPNTALLSLILMIGTFIIAFKLKKFRNSKYLGRGIRRALGDFGVPISIILMVLLDFLIDDTYTDKLIMPVGIQPTNTELRGWFINPFGMQTALPVWAIFLCAPASVLLFILIFIEGNICQLILSKPERNMKKGTGYHWDILLSCLVNCISGVMGAPFMTPACVRSVSHASALTIVDTKVAPGESPKIVGAHEQRMSALFVSVFIGLSIFLASLLNLVPNAVLYGVFLYMGVSATAGIQFLERCILFLVPVKHHPNIPFVKNVKTMKMHMFTAVQLLMIVVLWVVKQSPAALCFPFVLMILVPIRLFLLPYAWTPTELVALDGGSAPTDDKDEPDFYEEVHNLGNEIPPPHNHQN